MNNLTKITIIRLICIGIIFATFGLTILAYAADSNPYKYIPAGGGSGIWQKPEETYQLRQLPALNEEERINSYVEKIKNGNHEERKDAIAALLKIVNDPKAGALFKENAIFTLAMLAKDKNLDSQTRKALLSALFNTVLSSKVDALTKEKAIATLVDIAKTSDPQTRKDALAVLEGMLDFSRVSESLKLMIVDSLSKALTDKPQDAGIGRSILVTFNRIANNSSVSDAVKQKAISALVKALKDETLDAATRKYALRILQGLAGSSNISDALKLYLNREINK